MDKDIRFRLLFEKYVEEREMTVAELAELQNFMLDSEYGAILDNLIQEEFVKETNSENDSADVEQIFNKFMAYRIDAVPSTNRFTIKSKLYKYLAVAAALLVFFTIVYFYHFQKIDPSLVNNNNLTVHKNKAEDQLGKAFLTLPNGQQVLLNDSMDGVVVGDGELKYIDGSPIAKENMDGNIIETVAPILSLSTALGGQYHIRLSDGTKVWLSSSSILKYPQKFNGNSREVELIGEAYFEVAKSKNNAKFIVKTSDQHVEVLGTHFNIKAYAEDKETITSLLEGAVQIKLLNNSLLTNSATLLKPGQQAKVAAGHIKVAEVNVDRSISWKSGVIYFENQSIQSVMKMLSKWYPITVSYDANISNTLFSGSIRKERSLKEVLEMLEETGDVKFRMDHIDSENRERRIKVMK